jgi:hypothetical protein
MQAISDLPVEFEFDSLGVEFGDRWLVHRRCAGRFS